MVDQKIIEFISRLGIGEEGAKIYLALIDKPQQTAQLIARKTSIPKTTIYRRLEELKKFEIVEEQVDEYKKVYTAAPADLLNLLVIKKEQEVKELRAKLPEVMQMLAGQSKNFDPGTKVLFYRGKDGIQQMVWNDLRAKTEIIGYTYRNITNFVGKEFTDKWNEEFDLSHQSGRDLYSDEYIKSKFEQNNPEIFGRNWKSKYLPKSVLDIGHQMDVYNNVVGIYNWYEGEVFGVEIYNEKVANLQRQIFKVLWKQAQTITYSEQEKIYKKLAILP